MDSANSGSLQYSSTTAGYDHEYDSRAASSFRPLFNNFPFSNHNIAPIPNLLRPQPPPDHLDHPNYPPNPASVPNLDAVWSKDLSTIQSSNSHLITDVNGSSDILRTQHDQRPSPVSSCSKKRKRISRRAPTTVLTTDTTNFRAMVQEFTGVPASPFKSSKLEFTNHLLRPFARKIQPPQFPFLSPLASTTNVNTSSLTNYQQPYNTNVNMLNPLLNFDSLKASGVKISASQEFRDTVGVGTIATEGTNINPGNLGNGAASNYEGVQNHNHDDIQAILRSVNGNYCNL